MLPDVVVKRQLLRLVRAVEDILSCRMAFEISSQNRNMVKPSPFENPEDGSKRIR